MYLKVPAVRTQVGTKAKRVARATASMLLEIEAHVLLTSLSGLLWSTEFEFKDLFIGLTSLSDLWEVTELRKACFRTQERSRTVCNRVF